MTTKAPIIIHGRIPPPSYSSADFPHQGFSTLPAPPSSLVRPVAIAHRNFGNAPVSAPKGGCVSHPALPYIPSQKGFPISVCRLGGQNTPPVTPRKVIRYSSYLDGRRVGTPKNEEREG